MNAVATGRTSPKLPPPGLPLPREPPNGEAGRYPPPPDPEFGEYGLFLPTEHKLVRDGYMNG